MGIPLEGEYRKGVYQPEVIARFEFAARASIIAAKDFVSQAVYTIL